MLERTNTNPLLNRVVALLALAFASQPVGAAPQDWTQALIDDPRLGSQVRWLESGDDKILYLYRPNQAPAERGTVILLHDLRHHADWPQVIGPLREQLPGHGWNTWSLQLPPPAEGAEPDAYLEAVDTRIAAALKAVTDQSDQPVILLGAGTGASAALGYLSRNPNTPVRGLAAVSLRPLPGQSLDEIHTLMTNVEPPLLEVYAERDHRHVLRGIEQRQRLAARPPSNTGSARDQPARYRQIVMEGADADYSAQTEALTKRIRGWMRAHTDR